MSSTSAVRSLDYAVTRAPARRRHTRPLTEQAALGSRIAVLSLVWQLGERAADEVASLQQEVQHGVAAVFACMVGGVVASWPWHPPGTAFPLVNVLGLLGSWTAFYWLLHSVTSMVKRIEALAAGLSRCHGLSRQYRIVRYVIVSTWHLFGIIWTVAACQLISPEAEQVAYIFSDLVAKYVLMFVYVAQGGVAKTRDE
jgi:hypothetical protein